MDYKINKRIAQLVEDEYPVKFIFGPRGSGKTTASILSAFLKEDPYVLYIGSRKEDTHHGMRVIKEIGQDLELDRVAFSTHVNKKIDELSHSLFSLDLAGSKNITIIFDNFSGNPEKYLYNLKGFLQKLDIFSKNKIVEIQFILDENSLILEDSFHNIYKNFKDFLEDLPSWEDVFYRIDYRERKDLTKETSETKDPWQEICDEIAKEKKWVPSATMEYSPWWGINNPYYWNPKNPSYPHPRIDVGPGVIVQDAGPNAGVMMTNVGTTDCKGKIHFIGYTSNLNDSSS